MAARSSPVGIISLFTTLATLLTVDVSGDEVVVMGEVMAVGVGELVAVVELIPAVAEVVELVTVARVVPVMVIAVAVAKGTTAVMLAAVAKPAAWKTSATLRRCLAAAEARLSTW